MSTSLPISAGTRFRQAMKEEHPLQIVGTINANHALLAARAGFKAIYLSGGGVAAGSLGIPDLGITTLDDVLTDIYRITGVTATPLMVDVDTGFGPSAFNVARTVKSLIKAGAGALHIEDQVGAKRCGHRPGKELVSCAEMADRIKAATDARTDEAFVIGARTDALASEGLEKTLERAVAYKNAGADFIFAEAVNDLSLYRKFIQATGIPVLANITEFGMTPLWTVNELKDAGVDMILYPLSAFRAANKAAQRVFETIRAEGSQKNMIAAMQTRDELYASIGYHSYEEKLDELFSKNK
ncbi:MAG: methylisocitrate lyase [Chitinophagaceae bacterium]|nr:methylisocitrate lyase [Chitinophagaceae bacterium]